MKTWAQIDQNPTSAILRGNLPRVLEIHVRVAFFLSDRLTADSRHHVSSASYIAKAVLALRALSGAVLVTFEIIADGRRSSYAEGTIMSPQAFQGSADRIEGPQPVI